MKERLFVAIALMSASMAWDSRAQVYSNREVGKKNAQMIDSIKHSEYPYALPIWGQKAAKLGFNLPYSAGLGVNYLWQRSDLVIENLKLGFNNGTMYDLNEIVRFSGAKSEASGVNFRPDIWLFPFLNVYGIFAKAKPSTAVDFGIWVPDQNGQWNQVIAMNTKANFNATTYGFGLTPTIGISGGWFALDMNFTWNDISELDKPAFAFVFGPRLGKTFKLRRPESNIALWCGGFRLKLNTGTQGSLNINELIDTNGLQARVDSGIQQVENTQTQVDAWWNGLNGLEQKNPANIARHDVANRVLGAAGTFLGNMDMALSDSQHATVQYSLDKRPKDMWNFIVGTQYQYNKHWMVRAEYGFLGSRTQLITGLQYRFGL